MRRALGRTVSVGALAVLLLVNGSAAAPGAETPTATKPPKSDSGVTTLEDITIEGEIAMPQVLFITARDQYRYRDLLHRRYLPTAEAMRASIPVPYQFWAPETGLRRWYSGRPTLGGGADVWYEERVETVDSPR